MGKRTRQLARVELDDEVEVLDGGLHLVLGAP
jgi:hypothetical protein